MILYSRPLSIKMNLMQYFYDTFTKCDIIEKNNAK